MIKLQGENLEDIINDIKNNWDDIIQGLSPAQLTSFKILHDSIKEIDSENMSKFLTMMLIKEVFSNDR